MPELPEVETVRRILQQQLKGKRIIGVDIFYPNMLKNIPQALFQSSLVNQIFVDVKRRGKFLLFILSGGILVSHLRMEGKFFIKENKLPLEKHEHIVFRLQDGMQLRYHDVRKFGTMHLFLEKQADQVLQLPPLETLGVEPFSVEFTPNSIHLQIKKSTRAIKSILLDQTLIAGVGNIYANEICFLSKIDPRTPGSKLSYKDIESIVSSTNAVLNKAISLGGTSIHSFQSSLEVSGRFQNELFVHMQKECKLCGTEIKKIFVGNRGTYYCPKCQNVH